ncbi:MAG: hypothetical protein Q7T11_05265 [Deltaproteobacteria bacterium]|nr:hypothetical protein [Deltaproteobacteria bacterium]
MRFLLTAIFCGLLRPALACPSCYKSSEGSTYLIATLAFLALLILIVGGGGFLICRSLKNNPKPH